MLKIPQKLKRQFSSLDLTSYNFTCIILSEVMNLTSKEIVNVIMKDQGVSNAEMAAKLDLTQAALWDRLNPKKTNNMTVKKLNEMLKMLDYKIVVVPRKSRVSERCYEVE